VSVSVDDVLGLLIAGDFDSEFLRSIPPRVLTFSAFNPAVYIATTCEEGAFPWNPSASPEARRAQARAALAATPSSAFAPFDRAAGLSFGLLPLCGNWPARRRVTAPSPPLPTTVSTLIVSGDLDLRTPLENASRLASALKAGVVVERGAGHSVLEDPNACATPAVEAFLAGRPLPRCRSGGAFITIDRSARSPSAPPGGLTGWAARLR